jgi:hypothetical protein
MHSLGPMRIPSPFRWSIWTLAMLSLSSPGSGSPPALPARTLWGISDPSDSLEGLWWAGLAPSWGERMFGGRGYSMMGPIYSPLVIHGLWGERLATLRELETQHAAPFFTRLPSVSGREA